MIAEALRDGQLTRMGLTIAAIGLVLLGERLAIRGVWSWYFDLSGPLGVEPVPLPAPPPPTGESDGLGWQVRDGRARWWVTGGRGLPSGLHGVVLLISDRRGVRLDVRWSPPWAPYLATAWLAGLGLLHGEGLLLTPISVVLAGLMFVVHRDAATRAAGRLRYTWANGSPDGR